MATIPLPALSIHPPQAPDAMEGMQRMLMMRNLMNQGQLQQQQLSNEQQQNTAMQQENQQRAIALKATQTLQSLTPQFVKRDDSGKPTGYDYEGLKNAGISAGLPPQMIDQITTAQKNTADAVLAQTNADKSKLEQQQKLQDQGFQHLESVRGVQDPAQRQAAWENGLNWAKQNGMDVSKLPQQAPDDATLTAQESMMGMHAQALSDAKSRAEAKEAGAKSTTEQLALIGQTMGAASNQMSWAARRNFLKSRVDPDVLAQVPEQYSPEAQAQLKQGALTPAQEAQTPVEKMELKDFMANPPAGYPRSPTGFAKYKKDQDVQAHIAEQTSPAVIQAKVFQDAQRAKAELAVKNGSAQDAGKMLAQGLIAPSEIAARSNPSFLVEANKAATAADPNYNAQKAEAEFKVASSPANVAFFGSANSLTNKGGTLDQLAEAAKALPNGQFPAFNTLADWEKAATGSGPIAKYASIALGVADDYSKVMGGGQGSDSSRTQALKLIGASQSPEQRAGSIDGIRGAVNSQTDSRIGKNKVLRNMYGQEQGGAAGLSVKAPNGKTYTFPDQKSLDAFKQAAGIQN